LKNFQINSNQGVQEIKISDLSKGVYNLEIKGFDGQITTKQVIFN